MRLFLKSGLFLVLGTILFSSCKNDLNILAPYKESVSVYALLNPQESHNYVRINKIFLGEGNAYAMAQVQDSASYKPGELTVTLERFQTISDGVETYTNAVKGSSQMKITLRDTVLTLEPGSFNQNQRLYYTTSRLETSGKYKLTITNNNTGNTFTSKTTILDSVIPGYQQPLAGGYYPLAPTTPTAQYVDYSYPSGATDKALKIQFKTPKNAREFNVIIRLHYTDSLVGSVATIPHYVDLKLPAVSSLNLDGGEDMFINFNASSVVEAISAGVKKNGDPTNFYSRRAIRMDFFVTSASQDFVDFIYVSAPSTTVAQDKPTYSNIEGGYGIFGSRSRCWVKKSISNNFINFMATRKPLCDLRFVNASGAVSSFCN